jgi:peroxiredoxin
MFGKKASVGKRAPDFTLQAVDKNMVSLKNYRGKTVLLVFLRSSG